MAHRRLPSLSALRAFEAAARHESAKQAAEELSVTATAISHQIRSLEESLGVALFLRKPRKLELTDQGRELQQTLETAFDSISATIERLSAKPCRQAITLSTTPAIAVRWLVPWVCLPCASRLVRADSLGVVAKARQRAGAGCERRAGLLRRDPRHLSRHWCAGCGADESAADRG